MRYVKVICLLIAAVVAVSAPAKKPKDKNKYGVYLAGVSASFSDSLVFFEKNRTCFMFFNRKKAKLEKEMKKLRDKYRKGGTLVIRDVDAAFKFEKPAY